MVSGPDVTGRDHLRLLVAYDGTDFHGFAENAGVRTVGGELRSALTTVLGSPVELTCAGRTDAGVHARGQVVSVRGELDAASVDRERLRASLVGMLGPEVVVRSVDVAPAGFDARFSATGRTYRYRILDRPDPDPFLARQVWWIPESLDVGAMGAAAGELLGEHDFSTFCRRPKGDPDASLVRRVEEAAFRREDGEGDGPGVLRFEITASAFCHQMVRSVVGLLAEVGRGRRSVADVARALEARDRAHLPTLAPPRGLTLWSVRYE